jgi:simple sugar transport system ATP-binding protein
VYQEGNLVPTLSVAENLFLGRQPRNVLGIRWGLMRRQAREAMGALGLDVDVDAPLGSLPLALQQMVAIARAVRSRARVIIFDEPTSSLDQRETDQLFELMRALRGRGMGLVFITHFIEQVYRISDRITVLRNGRNVGTLAASKLPRSELVAWMLGERGVPAALVSRERDRAWPAGHLALRVTGLGKKRVLEPLDLAIRPGEVVGLAGLLGSGRTETANLIFGVARQDSGSVEVGGERLRAPAPRGAIKAGIGMMPEDRKAEGLFLGMSVRDNVAMVVQRQLGLGLGLMRRWRHNVIARKLVQQLGIATPSIRKPVGQLSGGNQQKVLLARWMAVKPRVLIMDEPTRGVDVGAKAQIELLIEQLGRAGMAILFISAELDEVARRCDRIVVLRDRRKVGELNGAAASAKVIMDMISG